MNPFGIFLSTSIVRVWPIGFECVVQPLYSVRAHPCVRGFQRPSESRCLLSREPLHNTLTVHSPQPQPRSFKPLHNNTSSRSRPFNSLSHNNYIIVAHRLWCGVLASGFYYTEQNTSRSRSRDNLQKITVLPMYSAVAIPVRQDNKMLSQWGMRRTLQIHYFLGRSIILLLLLLFFSCESSIAWWTPPPLAGYLTDWDHSTSRYLKSRGFPYGIIYLSPRFLTLSCSMTATIRCWLLLNGANSWAWELLRWVRTPRKVVSVQPGSVQVHIYILLIITRLLHIIRAAEE